MNKEVIPVETEISNTNSNVNISETEVTTQNETTATTDNSSSNPNITTSNQTSNILEESNTAIIEYLEVVKSEYEIERGKKESFENRVGIILALIGAMCIFLLELIKPSEIFSIFTVPLTFSLLLKIIFGFLVYLGLGATLLNSFIAISTKKQANFEVKNINERLLADDRMTALAKIIFTYRDIIVQHRHLNEKRAKAFKRSLTGCVVTIISTIIYYAIK